jgi:hypothetical protein
MRLFGQRHEVAEPEPRLILAQDCLTGEPVTIPTDHLRRGLHVIGTPGEGKSSFLVALLEQFIRAGQSFGLMEPEGQVYGQTLARLAAKRADPARTVLLEPSHKPWAAPLNVLKVPDGVSPATHVDVLLRAFERQYASEGLYGPRMADFLRHLFLLTVELKLTLYEALLAIMDTAYCDSLARASTNPMLRGYFLSHLHNIRASERAMWAESSRNKLAPLVLSEYIAPAVVQDDCLDFLNLIESGASILVHTSQKHLHEDASLVGMLVQALLAEAVSRRAENASTLFPILIDEFQMVANRGVLDLLTRARRRGVGLILGHHSLYQPPFDKDPAFVEVVLAVAHTKVVFRVGRRDAERLSGELFRISGDVVKIRKRHPIFGPHGPAMYWSVAEQKEHWTRQIQDQAIQECFVSLQNEGISTHECETYLVDRLDESGLEEFREACFAAHCIPRETALACIERREERLYTEHGIKPPLSIAAPIQEEIKRPRATRKKRPE